MNVLIVEDNPISSKVLEHALDGFGWESYTAKDGAQALDYLNAHAEVDLLITDIVMPNTDGFQLLDTIRNRVDLRDLPIVVCTSKPANEVAKHLPRDPGCKYLPKPVNAINLKTKIKEAMALRRSVMQSPDETMAQIGMDSCAFVNVLDEFLKLVNEKVALLEDLQQKENEASVPLEDLKEGSKLLRANRLTDVLNELIKAENAGRRDQVRSLYPVVLRELKAMRYYLTLYSA